MVSGEKLNRFDEIVSEKIKSLICEEGKVKGSILSRFPLRLLTEIFRKREVFFEEPLIKVNLKRKATDLIFVGDLHGDYDSLLCVVSYIKDLVESKRSPFIVFLGDYVDRGPKQLECLAGALVLAKDILPGRVVMLRGNHETPSMNHYYGFYRDLINRYGTRRASIIYDTKILPIYTSMPLAILIEDWRDNRIFGVHGGIPITFEDSEWRTPSLKELTEVKLQKDYTSESYAFQMLWNDPDEYIEEYEHSFRGNGIYIFGSKIVEDFTKKNNINLIVRSHLAFRPHGFKIMFGGKLISIFTCRYYQVPPTILHLTPKYMRIVDLDSGEALVELSYQ
ncbi:MAG: hypothetical protein DRJ52_08575 [Thermoprotei archaeon]|nr:MAG: hypothetical protein DRJ52_08575 [Thermoprotei archaeon]RLE98730.1 MAG: hypothetical protein DRJ63_07295 [Thermoprotei archaeon]HDI74748.1 hypothetical protein [Thermoprotei archaeon]